MRTNGFNETYCHTAAEAHERIAEAVDDVYVPGPIDPPSDGDKACVEIALCGSGELVCYVEADTVEQVKAILTDLNLEVST